MGYDIHITRKDFYCEDREYFISLEEWLSYVDDDPSIEIDRENLTDPPKNFVVKVDSNSWPLWYDERYGNIHTKNPSNQIIGKMVEIAKALQARVQGDDGEYYANDSVVPICSDSETAVGEASTPWWRFW